MTPGSQWARFCTERNEFQTLKHTTKEIMGLTPTLAFCNAPRTTFKLMLDFFAKPFAIAGIIAAAGPIIIHLLNRRRYRVVNWAAMDFLREALQRNRKILQMRDLILLVLRVLCVLLVGLALARPFFATSSGESVFQQTWPWLVGAGALGLAIWAVLSAVRITKIAVGIGSFVLAGFAAVGFYDFFQSRMADGEEALSHRHPVHAVLVLDNSLSMGYETLEGNLLDQAKAKAAEFIDQLPSASFVSIIPLCGSPQAFTLDAHRSQEDARDALNRIEVVDRRGTSAMAIQLAAEALEQVPELPSKRVVFLGDQQVTNWPSESLRTELAKLPELQVVKVSAESPENVWISDFRIQDGIADIETPSTFLATVESHGAKALKDVQVALSVDGVSVASQTFDLEPKQARLLEFKYQIDVPAESGRPQFVNAAVEVQTATIEGDRLKSDNVRHLVVPVVAGLPVVFVDQLGPAEDVKAGEVGETYPLRRYLAPRVNRDDYQRQLIQIRHVTIDQIDRPLLEDARLVVIGGVENPGQSVPILREYVEQGGQLVITAGANFDPSQWTEAAWLDGVGILPMPLDPEPFGATPDELELVGNLDQIKAFSLDFSTMQHPYFVLENMNVNELASWYRLTMFFKSVQPEFSSQMAEDFLAREVQRLTDEQQFLTESAKRKTELEAMQKQGTFGNEQEAEQSQDEARVRRLAPKWLLWQQERIDERFSKSVEVLAKTSLPEILARYDVKGRGRDEGEGALPFLIQRRMGQGKVLLFTSGTYSSWNTLAGKNSNISLFDRILRQLIEDTMPPRTFEAGEAIVMPVEPDRSLRYTLTKPTGDEESLTVSALGADVYGLSMPVTFRSGPYQITASNPNTEETLLSGAKHPVLKFAVNGPTEESDLTLLDRSGLEERLGSPGESGIWRWIDPGESISLEGAEIRGRDYWKTIVLIILAGLVLEMLVLAWPAVKQDLNVQRENAGADPLKERTA